MAGDDRARPVGDPRQPPKKRVGPKLPVSGDTGRALTSQTAALEELAENLTRGFRRAQAAEVERWKRSEKRLESVRARRAEEDRLRSLQLELAERELKGARGGDLQPAK